LTDFQPQKIIFSTLKIDIQNMKDVVFLKAGNPYGYGYSAGEVGKVYDTDQTRDTGRKTKDDKPIFETIARGFDWLQQNGIVRTATASDKQKAAEKEDARAAKSTPRPTKAAEESSDEKK